MTGDDQEAAAVPGGARLQLRNKLSVARHTQTTTGLQHEKKQMTTNLNNLHQHKKRIMHESMLTKGQMMRCDEQIDDLERTLFEDRQRLEMVERKLALFESVHAGDVAAAQATIVDGFKKGQDILRNEFGYNKIYRRPHDTFYAYGTVEAPKMKR